MTILGNGIRWALGIKASHPNEITTSQDLDQWIRFGGDKSVSGAVVNVRTSDGLAAVAGCVRALSDPIASLPLNIFRKAGDTQSKATDLSIYRVLHDQPNVNQTSFQFRKLWMRDLLYRGNAFAVKVPGVRGVQGLIRLHPDTVEVKVNKTTLVVAYCHRRDDGSTHTYNRDQIFHLWMNSDDGFTGLSPIALYRETIGDGLAIRNHGSRFFSNGATPLGLLEMEGDMGKEGRDAFRDDWETIYQGGANAHKTLLLPAGMTYKPVSLSMEDAQWIEARKATAREICGIFGVPPNKIGDLADATFSNVENENLDFVVSTLTPWLVAWEQAIKRDLLPDPDLFAKFNVSALLRGDSKARAEALQIQRRSGVINANEWRDLEDMNPRTDPGGNVYVIEANMQPNDGKESDRVKTSATTGATS